ncbi:MAG: PAS domain-containing protein, partial [Parvibaculum sp.]|nr:PAS domain-containing protein [Parvibaculum sp.]
MEDLFRDTRLARLLDYWRGKRGNRPAPARRNIRPMELGPLIPIVHLIDVHQDPLGFCHRLVGA